MVSVFPKYNASNFPIDDPAFPAIEIINLGGVLAAYGKAFYNGSINLPSGTWTNLVSLTLTLPRCLAVISFYCGSNHASTNIEISVRVLINGASYPDLTLPLENPAGYIHDQGSKTTIYELEAGDYTFKMQAQARGSNSWVFLPTLVVLAFTR